MTTESKQDTPCVTIGLVRFNTWPHLLYALINGVLVRASSLIELAMKEKQQVSPLKAVALGHNASNVILGQIGHDLHDFNNDNNFMFATQHRYSPHYL
ncbi:nitrate ABC transporter substrate-binding protein, partial [Staphylococcus pseudintermedius]